MRIVLCLCSGDEAVSHYFKRKIERSDFEPPCSPFEGACRPQLPVPRVPSSSRGGYILRRSCGLYSRVGGNRVIERIMLQRAVSCFLRRESRVGKKDAVCLTCREKEAPSYRRRLSSWRFGGRKGERGEHFSCKHSPTPFIRST